MSQMFRGAIAYDQGIADWNVSAVTSMSHIFSGASGLSETNKSMIHSTFSINPNWSYNWGTPTNSPPSELNASASLVFPENLPIGTIIGTFSANDPDGDTLTYSLFRDDNLDPDMIEMRIMELEALSQDPLQSSEDLAQNAQEKLDLEIKLPLIRSQEFFLLDNNGSLRTAGQFDFEQNTTSYWVRVIATDEHNASVEKDFEIILLNDSADDPSEIISSSIRAKVNGQLVVGIVVEDSLDLVIRGLGPSLAQYGLTNVMSNPQLTLVDQTTGTVMVTNDDWQAASNQSEISLSNQSPGDPKEAAVLLTLDAGEYSILLSDSTGGNGTALLEVINLDPAKNGKIQSVGVRGEVDSVEPMIHSLNLQGSNQMSLLSLLRGKDSLASFGVPNGLPNPRQFINQ